MEYLTSKEIAEKWGLTARIVALDCQAGRIEGAVKKGKQWLIPSDVKKPVDGRRKRTKVKIYDNEVFKDKSQHINKIDLDNLQVTYHTSDIYKNLGVSRETLRYYEELGLIKAKRNGDSQYREFDIFDIAHLMSIDFYKKRGFSAAEIIEAMTKANTEELQYFFDKKQQELETVILRQQRVLKRLKETKAFNEQLADYLNKFTIKIFPLYEVHGVFSAVTAFNEYRDKVIENINLPEEDVLSKMVRTITFDDTGYTGSQMCVIKIAESNEGSKEALYLEEGKCLYTVIAADNKDNAIMENMYSAAHKWAKEHNVELKGIVYIFIRLILFKEQGEQNFYEVWIPIK